MKNPITLLLTGILLFSSVSPAQAAGAKDRDYNAVVKHLKSRYQAKKVKIPFLGLARFAMKFVKPAGVRSFNIAVFEDLKFTEDASDQEIALRNSLSAEWCHILKVRSREGERVYLYIREDKKYLKLMLVTIEKEEATVIRAKISPDKVMSFIDNPKILGVSLGKDAESKN